MNTNPFKARSSFRSGKHQMKETDNKVVTPFISPAESKQRRAQAQAQFNEDIHVGPNTQLVGGFHTQGMMIVDGRVEGADITADRLVVSHIGQLLGKAKVQRAELSGAFEGDLVAEDEVILRPTARVSGTVRCQRLVVHRGARMECHFSCAPEPGNEEDHSGNSATKGSLGGHPARNLGAARDRRLFITGAGSVFALLGMIGMLIGLRMLLAWPG